MKCLDLKIRSFLLGTVLFGMTWGGYGQSSGKLIFGKVVYDDDRSPVPYAILTTTGGSRSTSCDSLGNFQLSISDTENNERLFVSGFACVSDIIDLDKYAGGFLTIALERRIYSIPEVVILDSRRGTASLLGDTTHVSTNNSYYRFKRGQEIGVLVKNKRRIILDALYIGIGDTPLCQAPLAVRIKKGTSMRPNRIYDSNEFTDILPELLICRAERSGILKIDLSRYKIQVGSDLLILLSPASSDPEFDYKIEQAVMKMSANGRMSRSMPEPVDYYGAVLEEYPVFRKDIYFLTGINRRYAYSDVPRMGINPPLIAVGYRRK